MKRIDRVRTVLPRQTGRMAGAQLDDRRKGRSILIPAQQTGGEAIGKILKAQEAERRRIARELHDEFGQHLTGLRFDLAWLRNNLGQQPRTANAHSLIKRTEAMLAAVDALMASVRHTATALHPCILDDLGLLPAVEWLAKDFQTRTNIQCTTLIDPVLSDLNMTVDSSTALFRIVQEVLTNVVRHAQASTVNITMFERAEDLVLELADNGKGINRHQMKQRGSFGLRGIHERVVLLGGTVNIVGEPGHGTTVSITLPHATIVEARTGTMHEQSPPFRMSPLASRERKGDSYPWKTSPTE
ncbi:MAG: sensor histidine kinase [Nitrospira sp.]